MVNTVDQWRSAMTAAGWGDGIPLPANLNGPLVVDRRQFRSIAEYEMALRITGMAIRILFSIERLPSHLLIDYTPAGRDEEGNPRECPEYATRFIPEADALPHDLLEKLLRISEFAFAQVDVPEVDLGDVTVRGTITPHWYQVDR